MSQFSSHQFLFQPGSQNNLYDTNLESKLDIHTPLEKPIYNRKQYKIPLAQHRLYAAELLAKQILLANPKPEKSAIPLENNVAAFGSIENKKTRRVLGKVEKFFLSAFSTVFGEGIRESLGIISLEKRKEWHRNYLEHEIKPRIVKSKEARAIHRNPDIRKGHSNYAPMKVNEQLFVEEGLLHPPSSLNLKDVHKTTARIAVLEELHLNPNLDFDFKLGKMVSYLFEGDDMKKGGGVVPTSYILGNKDKAKEEHLMNIYVLDLGDGRAVIRSGRVDTDQRSQDFLKIIEELSGKKHLDKPLRVVSQQLNNFENESKMINGQHRRMAQVNQKLGDKAELVHINVPSNRWVHVTKQVDSWGIFGKFLKKLPKNLFQGEKLSKAQNLDSWGTYVKWVSSDLQGIDGIEKQLVKLEKSIKNLDGFKIDADNALVAGDKDALKLARIQEKSELKLQYKRLGKIEALLAKAEPEAEVTAALQKVILMRSILGSQLNIKKMDRGQEGMMIQMLNDKLGVISAMNCKSGLDRTGFWHAVKLAMLTQEEKIGSERAFRLVNNWERTTDLMNKVDALGEQRLMAYFEGRNSWDAAESEISDLLPLDRNGENFEEWRQTIEDIMSFRQEVLNNLIEVGIPITTASTGLMGLKWNSGIQENLLPLNFLPAYVTVGENNDRVRLVKYDSKGEISGLSTWGKRLITKFNKLRGS